MSPLSRVRAKGRPTTDYERWLNYNPDHELSSPPKYNPDQKYRYGGSPVGYAPNRQLMFNTHPNRPLLNPSHPRHPRRPSHSQGLIRGITFFCAVLVVIVVIRMFVVSLIRASQRRREIEQQIQDTTRRQEVPAIYVDNNELDELQT
ncbi:uncharacterized protein ACLA_072860 [Aspergillus clavatus NRRL 1]|uniref:Uncharacterized protein n=1 Tax=Aspergillus clavatus (strain ATCC 1007 / CBS 513.65 / DSM 816 / NCTC 3887 / NRRL 1 / QM 1276 / 107) TaxID=344612 RepID=A1C782_ASPCL|nr:uncharacterized protein ACLA_072860 [Aspergillus clavatus NRRL 1]EAW14253.1 hypothetical protein ACLA_072860 [Aspergillus clavatus NRRL 1]